MLSLFLSCCRNFPKSLVFLNFIILDKINKIFVKFLRLLNKSLFGIPSDDCIWGFTVSSTQLSYFSTEKKKLIRGKILSKAKTDSSALAISHSFLLRYRPKQSNKLYSTVVTKGSSIGANQFQILSQQKQKRKTYIKYLLKQSMLTSYH